MLAKARVRGLREGVLVIAAHAYTLAPDAYLDRLLAALDGLVGAMAKFEGTATRRPGHAAFNLDWR